jgi:hypothetical protein
MSRNLLKSEFWRRLFRGDSGRRIRRRLYYFAATRPECFGAGLIVGKLLTLKGPKTWNAVAGLPTLNP